MSDIKGKIDKRTLKRLVEEDRIQTVIIAGVDMQGRLFGKRFCAQTFLDSFKGGAGTCSCNLGWDMDLELIPGLEFTGWHTGYQDMMAIPDFETLRIYPWFEKTAIVLCDSAHEDGSLVSIAPRTILRRQTEKAGNMGYIPFMASELEFFLFNETVDSARKKDYKDLEPISKNYSDYSIFRTSLDEWITMPIREGLNDLGLEVESTKGEWGHGQVELAIKYAEAVEMGDRHALMKNSIKEIAALNGLMATFMAKHSTDASGSGLHIHTSLWDNTGKKNAFYNSKDEHGMSELMRHFMGGMMHLAQDMQFFYAPTINSYKRYCKQSFAPYNISWGGDNRTVTFRICGHGSGCRIENRIPGADVCSYLSLAACLGSGLYGIENKLEPIGPFITGDSYAQESLPELPRNMMAAVKNLDESKPAREIFGDDVVDHYVKVGQWEIEKFLTSVTDWERRKYFELG